MRTGSLWMAVGLHLSNNWSNVVLVGTKGDVLKPVAPFVAETPDLARITTIIALQTLVTILVLVVLIKKREAKSNI